MSEQENQFAAVKFPRGRSLSWIYIVAHAGEEEYAIWYEESRERESAGQHGWGCTGLLGQMHASVNGEQGEGRWTAETYVSLEHVLVFFFCTE